MNAWFLNCYIEISILIAVIDGILAIKSILKNKTTGRYLGFACADAAVVDISYLISILNNDYRCVSVMSSIYFVNIDIMLVCLLIFTVYFTKGEFTKPGKTAIAFSILYAVFEAVPFTKLPSTMSGETPTSPSTAIK